MDHLSFLGLGRMGSAIAERMLQAGTPLTVWNRSESAAVTSLRAVGATVASTAADALTAPISFSMLADDRAAEAVLSVENLGTSEHPRIHVNMASVSTKTSDLLARRFAELGIAYVAAPVLGRPEVAAAGKLNVLLAGPSRALDVVEPVLEACSTRRWRLGTVPRQASAVKISMNYMLLQALESMAESIALVEAEGVDAENFVELFTNSFFGGMVHQVYGGMIARREYYPAGFTLALGLKDLGLAEELAEDLDVDLATSSVIRSRFEAALAEPALAGADWSAVAEVSRRPRAARP